MTGPRLRRAIAPSPKRRAATAGQARTLLASTLLPLGQNVRANDVVLDSARDLLYVSTDSATIARYDLRSGSPDLAPADPARLPLLVAFVSGSG